MQVPSDSPSPPSSSAANILRPISPSSVHNFPAEQCPPIILPTIPAAGSDDDPPKLTLLYEEQIAARKREDIQALKQRALVEKQNAPLVSEDEDDDLVILPSPKKGTTRLDEEYHRSTRKERPSEGRKVQLNFAGMNLSMQKSGAAPRLGPLNNVGSSTSRRKSGITRDELNTSLWTKVKGDIRETIQKREADYMKAGGRILITESPAEVSEKSLNMLVERGLKAAAARIAGAIEDDSDNEHEDDDDDSNWMPEDRGSVSPEPEPDEDQDADEVMADDVGGDVLIDDLDDQENINIRSSHRRRTVFDSDDDVDEAKPIVQHPSHNNVLPDKSFPVILESEDYMSASADERAENETDKENDTGLMFDYSEDKENKAVVRHAELGPLGGSLSLRGETQRSSPMSSPDLGEALDSRRPFQELVGGDSPQVMQLASTNLTQTFALQLRRASSHLSTNSSTLIPAACIRDSDLDEFQQFSGKTSSTSAAASIVLQPSFSDLFESATEKQGDARPSVSFKGKEKV
jgi:mediator of replication checkpoint protein 1